VQILADLIFLDFKIIIRVNLLKSFLNLREIAALRAKINSPICLKLHVLCDKI
jgi:hypothetical protein